MSIFVLKLDIYVPSLHSIVAPGTGTTGEPVAFNATAEDNQGVRNVTIEYWYGNSSNHTTLHMNLTSGSAKNGTWGIEFTASENSLGPLRYVVTARDMGGNENASAVGNVTIFDNDDPAVTVSEVSDGTTGDIVRFECNASDNVDVALVNLTYWYGDNSSSAKNVSMEGLALTGLGNGTYILNLTAPLHSLDNLNYLISVRDSSGNWNVTPAGWVRISDNDDAVIVNLSDTNATTGDPFHFEVDVQDNIGVSLVYVEYLFGPGDSTPGNDTLLPVNVTSNGNGTYAVDIYISEYMFAMFTYHIVVIDTSGNRAGSGGLRIIEDNDAPFFREDTSDDLATTGDPFHFGINVTDYRQIKGVWVTYRFEDDDGNHTVEMELDHVHGGFVRVYMFDNLTMDPDRLPRLFYFFTAEDINGNVNVSDEVMVNILDNDPPTFGLDRSDTDPIKGWLFNLSIEVMDNIGVDEVVVFIRFGDGTGTNLTMMGDGPYSKQVLIPRHPGGDLHYRFEAHDLAGFWVATDEVTLTARNLLPILDEAPTWNLTEGVEGTFDLGPYLDDGNDGRGGLTVVLDAEVVLVDGLVLRTTIDVWTEDFTIVFRVTDGEAETFGNLTISIAAVNDLPVITNTDVTVEALEDEPFSYQFQATDEENDPVTWSDDANIFDIEPATGWIGFTPDQSTVGTLSFTIWASDGVGDPVPYPFTINVKGVNDPPEILGVLPPTGSTFNESDAIEFSVEVYDEDGDVLSITWSLEDDTIGQGITLTFNGLPPGDHTIRVYVSDGQTITGDGIVLHIEERETVGDEDTFPTWIVVLLLVIVGVPVVLLVMRGRRGG